MSRVVFGLIVLFSMINLGGCGKLPFAPTNSGSSGFVGSSSVPNWSPFVLVHCNGSTISGHETAIRELSASGALKGIRTGAHSDGMCKPFIDMARGYGIDILGIIPMADYMVDNWRHNIDIIIGSDLYRGQISVFQIGNEIQNGPSWGEFDITIEQYTSRFMEIYQYVGEKYSGTILMSQSTISSTYALQDTEKMISLGLKNTDPNRVIIGMNIYTVKSGLDFSYVRSLVPRHRVWITETGVRGWDRQIQFVNEQYPWIRSVIGPSKEDGFGPRIYWYALWAGDEGVDEGFSLIKNPFTPEISRGPLYRAISGVN